MASPAFIYDPPRRAPAPSLGRKPRRSRRAQRGSYPGTTPLKGGRGWAGDLSTLGRGAVVLPVLLQLACRGHTVPCATPRRCSHREWGTPILQVEAVCCESLALERSFLVCEELLVALLVCLVLLGHPLVTVGATPTDINAVACNRLNFAVARNDVPQV